MRSVLQGANCYLPVPKVSTGRWGQSPWWAPPEGDLRAGLETGASDGSFLTEEDRERIADIVAGSRRTPLQKRVIEGGRERVYSLVRHFEHQACVLTPDTQ